MAEPSTVPSPRDFAILVGINRYPLLGKDKDLQAPENDVAAVREWLVDANGGGLDPKHVRTVLSSQFDDDEEAMWHPRPGPDDISTPFQRLLARWRAEQFVGRRLYVYMSGHGFAPKRDLVALLAANASDDFGAHAVGVDLANPLLFGGMFEQVVVWMDCCAESKPVFAPAVLPFKRIDDLERNAQMRIYGFAAQHGRLTHEREIDGRFRSVFTHALLQALRSADARVNRDIASAMTARSLKDHLDAQQLGAFWQTFDDVVEPFVILPGAPGSRPTRSIIEAADAISETPSARGSALRLPPALPWPAACASRAFERGGRLVIVHASEDAIERSLTIERAGDGVPVHAERYAVPAGGAWTMSLDLAPGPYHLRWAEARPVTVASGCETGLFIDERAQGMLPTTRIAYRRADGSAMPDPAALLDALGRRGPDKRDAPLEDDELAQLRELFGDAHPDVEVLALPTTAHVFSTLPSTGDAWRRLVALGARVAPGSPCERFADRLIFADDSLWIAATEVGTLDRALREERFTLAGASGHAPSALETFSAFAPEGKKPEERDVAMLAASFNVPVSVVEHRLTQLAAQVPFALHVLERDGQALANDLHAVLGHDRRQPAASLPIYVTPSIWEEGADVVDLDSADRTVTVVIEDADPAWSRFVAAIRERCASSRGRHRAVVVASGRPLAQSRRVVMKHVAAALNVSPDAALSAAIQDRHAQLQLGYQRQAGDVVVHGDPMTVSLTDEEVVYLYRDPRVDAASQATLGRRYPKARFTTPLERISKQRPHVGAIALSISESEDIHRLGMDQKHLERAMTDVARYLLLSGARLVYGGRPRLLGGYVELLADTALEQGRLIVARVPWSARADGAPGYSLEPVDPPPDFTLEEAARAVTLPLSDALERYLAARRLTHMRETITSETGARVLIGGKLETHHGAMPGVIEELLLSLRAKKPTFVIGSFGGAAELGGRLVLGIDREPGALVDAVQMRNPFFAGMLDEYRARGRARPAMSELVDELAGFGPDALNNGLREDENRTLFGTRSVPRMIEMILRGLDRLSPG